MKDVSNISDEQLAKYVDSGELEKDVKEQTKKVKLTKWKKEPTLQQLKHDFTQAQDSQSKYVGNITKWDTLYDAPKKPMDRRKGSRVEPKLVRKQAEWRCPSLSEPFLATYNLFEVKALTHEDSKRAKQNSLILNRQFNTELNKVSLVDKIIRGVVKQGTVIVRVGWEYQEDKVKEKVMQFQYMPVQDEQMMQQVQAQYEELAQLQQQYPDSYEQYDEAIKAGYEMSQEQGQLLIAQPVGEEEQEVVKPIVNKPTVEVCNLKNIYIDPTCQGDLDKAQFVIHSYESSLSELQRAGYYQNLEFIKHKEEMGSYDHDRNDDAKTFTFQDKARQKLIVYEYWGYWDIDGTGNTKPIIASWVGDTLIRLEENPFPDKKVPFVVFNYIPEEDSIYGIPDAELLEDNQAIVGAVTRGMIDLLGKSANSQTGYSKQFLDASNKAKFRNGEDYEFNPNSDPRVHVHTHKYPEIPASAMNMIQMMYSDAEAISGVKAFSGNGGITAQYLGDTAAGARGILDAVSKREMSILRRISEGFIILGKKIISMNSQFLSEEEVVRVTNSQFVKVRREDLAGNFDLVLTISTAEADDAKAKELAFMLQTMGNTMGQEVSQMILGEIADLRKMPELAEKIRTYAPEPDPIQQKLQELEVARLEAEIALLQSQAQENSAKAEVQSVKVNVEQARAASLQGDADNKALDFVERDSGTRHLRDLEKEQTKQEGANRLQQTKNRGELDKQVAGHNQTLLQQYAGNELQQQLGQQQQSVQQSQQLPTNS